MSETENKEIVATKLDENSFVAEAEKNVGFSKDESVIPFTRILQPLSPQLGSTPGAQAGMLLNIASGRLTDGKEGMNIVPILPMWNYTEWVKREDGGGFVADWGDDEAGWQSMCEPEQRHAYKPETKSGHAIVKARHFVVLAMFEDGTTEPSLLPFTGTALKVARQWSTMMQNAPKISTSKGMLVPAHFYYVYKLTVDEVKNSNYRWYEPRIRLLMKDNKAVSIMDYDNGKEIWQEAIKLRDNFKAGTIKAASQEEYSGTETEDRF
jgi:hypothetical protein